MELINLIIIAVLYLEIFHCVQAQVTFHPDQQKDIELNVTELSPVDVITTQCYSSEPNITVQYVTKDEHEAVYTIFANHQSTPIAESTCTGQDGIRYSLRLSSLRFFSLQELVGGTFRLKAIVNNDEENSSFSERTYTFPAPFNLTGSSMSGLLNKPFSWTCHTTQDNPGIEWLQDGQSIVQVLVLENGTCALYSKNESYPYTYSCQKSPLTYSLTIPGSSLTLTLKGTTWRCKDVHTELNGSKFMELDIVVPVTNVSISPGSGSTLELDEGKIITFTCTTNSANPPPTVLWYMYIDSSDVTSQVTGSNTRTLTLNVTRAEHQMSVRCVAWNSWNQANLSDSTTLNVRFPPVDNEELQIIGFTSDQVLYENNPPMISINCTQPGGNPVANMTFSCGSQLGINGDTATEAIRRVDLANNRTLNGQMCNCLSTHINGFTQSKSVSVVVYYPPSVPTISTSSLFPWKSEGTYNLTCNTTPGNPAATTYIWKEGVSVLPITSQTYEFKPLNSTDNGRQLSCQVNNNFTLHENVVLTSDVTTLQVLFQPATNETLKIVGYNSGQVLYENNSTIINVTCIQPGGNPVANMTFTCGSGKGPGANDNTPTEAIRRLSLTNSRILNGLKCECVSSHINGYTSNKSVTIIVYYPPSVPTISLSSSLPWKANGTYILTCNTTPGNPAETTYTWKEGVSVSITSQTYDFNLLKPRYNGRNMSCEVNNNFTSHENVTLTSNVTALQVEYDPDVTLDQSSVEVIEGHRAVLRCSATGNPLPTVTWYKDSTPVTESTISSSTYNITNASRTLTGYYTCKANSSSTGSNILQPDQKNTHLRVFYPPTVQIHLQNTTEDTENHTLRCSATGDPNNATIVALQQWVGSTLIRNITSFTESSPGNMTLNIDSVSYQDMGIYTCLASNGIPDRSNQKIQSDMAYLNVNTSAKFKTMEYTVRSDVGTQANITIPFYINPPATESDVMWINSTRTSNDTLVSSPNVTLSLSDADVNRTLHGVDVILHGQSANMDIPTFQDFYEGNYTLKVRSSHTDSTEVRIVLVRSGPPDTPSDFQLLTRKVTSVDLTWNKGSDGGHPQTFVILYKEKTAEVYKREELNDTSTNRNITYEIKSLKSNTNYYFLLYSFNKKGNSTGYKTLEEMTLKAPVAARQSSLNSGLVGGAAGGGTAVLVVVIVIIVVMRRRQHHGKGSDSKGILNSKEMSAGTSRQNDDDDGEDGLKDNPLYVSSTSEVNVAQGASVAPENPSLYAEVVKPKKKSPAKETVDPPPIYAEVNKSKEKNGKGPLKPKKKIPAKGGEDPPPIYAEVEKPNKRNDKGKQKKQKAKGKMEGDVYENVDGFKEKETQFNDPAEKQHTKESEPRGYRNQDGLLYIDVKFDQPPQKGKPIIHGEERTGYAMIEFEEPPTYSTADDVKGAEGGK